MPDSELESSVETFFRQRVRLLGGVAVKFIPVEAGAPDRMVLFRGRIFLVELKRDGGSLREDQTVWHRKARARGVRVHTVFGRDGVLTWLRWMVALDDPASFLEDVEETG